jgi:hypothetical protein
MFRLLDTNVLREDLLLHSTQFAMLLDYSARTRSPISLPRLMVDGLTANYVG